MCTPYTVPAVDYSQSTYQQRWTAYSMHQQFPSSECRNIAQEAPLVASAGHPVLPFGYAIATHKSKYQK